MQYVSWYQVERTWEGRSVISSGVVEGLNNGMHGRFTVHLVKLVEGYGIKVQSVDTDGARHLDSDFPWDIPGIWRAAEMIACLTHVTDERVKEAFLAGRRGSTLKECAAASEKMRALLGQYPGGAHLFDEIMERQVPIAVFTVMREEDTKGRRPDLRESIRLEVEKGTLQTRPRLTLVVENAEPRSSASLSDLPAKADSLLQSLAGYLGEKPESPNMRDITEEARMLLPRNSNMYGIRVILAIAGVTVLLRQINLKERDAIGERSRQVLERQRRAALSAAVSWLLRSVREDRKRKHPLISESPHVPDGRLPDKKRTAGIIEKLVLDFHGVGANENDASLQSRAAQ